MANDSSISKEDSEAQRIRNRIDRLVEEKKSLGFPRYYLSKLGSDLGYDDRVSLEKLTGMRLLDFIRDSYQLEISGQHKNIYAIVLSEANLPAVRFLDKSTPPRYNRRFWAAFGIPLGNDERRYLNVETMEFGSDKEALGDASADIREIGPDFINKERERLDPQLVAENVEKWLSQESLEPSRFTVGSKHANRAPRSVLDAMFLTLSQDDLRRITLPLDIVRKLLDKQNI